MDIVLVDSVGRSRGAEFKKKWRGVREGAFIFKAVRTTVLGRGHYLGLHRN